MHFHTGIRRLATAAFSFSGAVLLAQYIPFGPWIYWCSLFIAAASFAGFLFKTSLRLRLFLVLPAIAAGLVWTAAYRQLFLAPAESLSGTTAVIEAVVTGDPVKTDYGSKAVVRIHTDNARSVKALLFMYNQTLEAEPGSAVRFEASFRLSDTMYGEETSAYKADGIYLFAQSKGNVEIIGASPSIRYLPARLAGAVSNLIDRIFPSYPFGASGTLDTAGFMRALLLGDTTRLNNDRTLSSALRTSGTSHIVSVSGMNLVFLINLLGVFIRKKRLRSIIAIPVILFFMAIVGFAPSVVRAGVMQFFLLAAPLLRRESDALTSLSAALAFILLANPFSAVGAGLQLSFAATFGILLISEHIMEAADRRLLRRSGERFRLLRKGLRYIIECLATTLGALILTIPITALHFGTVSVIALLANLLIMLPVVLAFFAGAAAVALGFIYAPLGSLAASAASLPVRLIAFIAVSLAHVPFASIYTQNPPVVIWLVFVYLSLIIAVIMRVRPRRLLIPGCAGIMLLCLMLFLTSVFGNRDKLTVTALDVGQGQCIVIESGSFTAVVDCGSLRGNAAPVLEGFLQATGRLRIDLLILTHYHEDHAGSVPDILDRIPVGALALPDPSIDDGTLSDDILKLAGEKNAEIIMVEENLAVTVGETILRLYAPLGGADENERGLAVLCSGGTFDTLITGDMNAGIERRLIADAGLPDIEVLVVGHHGSKYSTSDTLLHALRPELAVISVGYNTYGHPSPVTLGKLAENGIAVYRTDLCGNVTIHAP